MSRLARRRFLGAAGLVLAAPRIARSATDDVPVPAVAFAPRRALVPIDARPDRIVEINVCTRPFRAEGPRVEVERIVGKTVVHNYGHGGSGWSLSWGSADEAVRLVVATGAKQVAVIGCGAIGLTSALSAQRAGLKVRIYARERAPQVRSSNATGVWSPDSRVCTTEGATPAFERRWEAMARFSFRRYQSLLGLPGDPVEWKDGYALSDVPFGRGVDEDDGEPSYPSLEGRLLTDLHPRSVALPPGRHPFPVPYVRRYTQMVFNLSAYARLLTDDFLRAGGEIVTRDFRSVRQLRALPETTLVNATGYGARALFGDASLVPVRGQTAKLVPQPGVDYGLTWLGHNLFVVARRDGLLVQAQAPGDFGNADVAPDRAATEAAVARLATLFAAARDA